MKLEERTSISTTVFVTVMVWIWTVLHGLMLRALGPQMPWYLADYGTLGGMAWLAKADNGGWSQYLVPVTLSAFWSPTKWTSFSMHDSCCHDAPASPPHHRGLMLLNSDSKQTNQAFWSQQPTVINVVILFPVYATKFNVHTDLFFW